MIKLSKKNINYHATYETDIVLVAIWFISENLFLMRSLIKFSSIIYKYHFWECYEAISL